MDTHTRQTAGGHALGRWLEQNGMTQARLAALAGVTQGSISRWLNGPPPGRDKCAILELLTGVESRLWSVEVPAVVRLGKRKVAA